MRRALLCCAGIAALSACGPASVAPAESSPPSSPSPSPSPAASVEVLSVFGVGAGTKVDLITISDGVGTDRALLANQDIVVLAANRRIALVATHNGTQLALLDLGTAAIRQLGVSYPRITWAALSPDGTQAAVKVSSQNMLTSEILIIDVGSGAVRHLQVAAAGNYRLGLFIWGWVGAGIMVSPDTLDCSRESLLALDPVSGTVTPLASGQVDILSPDGSMVAAAGNANLGEADGGFQCGWPNKLTAGRVGALGAVIAEQRSRAFSAFDLANDGSLLYLADGDASTSTPPTPDMGVYLEQGGQATQSLGETRVGQWLSGRLVGDHLALLSKRVASTVEIDLVGLCAASSCTPTMQTVLTVSGGSQYVYPDRMLVLGG